MRLAKVSGYTAMAKAEGVPLVALDDDGVFDKTGALPGKPIGVHGMDTSHVPTLLVPKLVAEALDHGLFVTLPKLKTHRYAVVSLGVKGKQGVTMYSDAAPAFHQKWRTHIEIDGALAAAEEGRARRAREVRARRSRPFAESHRGHPRARGARRRARRGRARDGRRRLRGPRADAATPVAIGGTNVVAVDKVGAQFLGLWDSDALAAGARRSPHARRSSRSPRSGSASISAR